jgi:4-amino-4-deoxy-L-arabinose transferase-like glycosyltransferase
MGRNKTASPPAREKTSRREEIKFVFSKIPIALLLVFLLLLAVTVWFGFYATHTNGVTGSDDREYVSIARNIVEGKGIVRDSILPLDLNFFKKLPIPDFMHPPGYPLIIAGFFKLFGVSDFIALLPSYLCYFILIFLVFHFAKKYVNTKTATIATIILIFNREILNYSCVALSEEVYTTIFFIFFIFAIRANSLRAIFFAGVILGVSHLIRENIYPFFISMLFFLYFYPDLPRWKKIGFFTFGLLIPISINIGRSYLMTGEPLFSYGKFAFMAFTDKYPWLNIYRDIQNPSLIEFIFTQPSQFLLKYLQNFLRAMEQVMLFTNPYLLAFFLFDMFDWKISLELKKIKILFLLLLLSQISFISLFTITDRYFIPFLPLMILFASGSFLRVSESLISASMNVWKKSVSWILVFLFLIFFVVPTTYLIIQSKKIQISSFKLPQLGYLVSRDEARKLNEFLTKELNKNQIVWTDLPEIIEWEGNRPSGWIPTSVAKIYEINKKIPVDAILLTNIRTPYRMEAEWQYLLFREQSIANYRTVKLYRGDTIFAKLFIRDNKE